MEIIRILIGMDVHKRSVYITEMEENGNVKEQYEIVNNESAWTEFMERYICMKTEISLEVSASGKNVARKLMDIGFSIHMADPSKLPLIFNTEKRNDREDSYKLAKLLRFGELPEVYLTSKYSDDPRSLVRYRRSLGESITMVKNRVHVILTSAGIGIDATDVLGKKGMKLILGSVNNISTAQRFVLGDLLDQITYLIRKESTVED